MQKTKLTVRVDQELLNKLKIYAAKNNTTLTNLINAYLRRIPAQGETEHSPLVQRLTGTLPDEASVEDYHKYQEKKCG
jgi:hypothetical protein